MTSAELCRANGWVVGDVLALKNNRDAQLRLTAIGDELVLWRFVFSDNSEGWEQHSGITNDWHKVGHVEKGE